MFGYLLCVIKDLDFVSESEGYDAGDRIIAETASVLADVFGKENVYRIVGSRFCAFGFETDETYFRDDVARFEKNARDRGINISVGPVYCINGAMDIRSVLPE